MIHRRIMASLQGEKGDKTKSKTDVRVVFSGLLSAAFENSQVPEMHLYLYLVVFCFVQ